MSRTTYNDNALQFQSQIVINDTTNASISSASLMVSGGLSAQDTYVTGHVAVNNVKITPNLNDIILEQQAVLDQSKSEWTNIPDFSFNNSVSNSFKAFVNITVAAGISKYAIWEINGIYKPSGWSITSSFTGDLTGINFRCLNSNGVGQIQYINPNGVGSTTTIRYRATTTAPIGTTPTGSVGIINNTNGPYIANTLLYSNTVNTLASTDLVYNSNVFKIGPGSRIVAENANSFTNFSNGGSITAMGDASVAQELIVGARVGVANTSPSFTLDVSGDINFTGNFYKNNSLYSGSSIWQTNLTDVFYTAGNVGLGTTSPAYTLDVNGTLRTTNMRLNDDSAINIDTGSESRLALVKKYGEPPSISTNATSNMLFQKSNSNSAGNPSVNTYTTLMTLTPAGNLTVTGTTNTVALSTGNLYATTLTINNANITNLTSVNINTDSVVAFNVNTGTLLGSTRVSTANIHGSNSTITNLLATNISTSTLFSTIGSFGTVSSTLLSATTMTGGSISLSGNLNVAGTLTVVNITSTNLVDTNITAATLRLTSTQIGLGNAAAQTNQGTNSVAIGNAAGQTSQGNNAVAMGINAGQTNQGGNAVAIGSGAGATSQSVTAVAIGSGAGSTIQGQDTVAIGGAAGNVRQGTGAVGIGAYAGTNSQGGYAVAIGYDTAKSNQGTHAVAIGRLAGDVFQGINAVAMGYGSGQNSQGSNAIAIGNNAGQTSQGGNAVAMGSGAGQTSQGSYAVAIGNNAGTTNQHTNSIILNAGSAALNSGTAGALYVNPIRNVVEDNFLGYDAVTKEVTYWSTSNFTTSNLVATNISSATLNLSTGITTATLLATTSISSASIQGTNSTITNAVHTTLSSGTLNASTGITTGTLTVRGDTYVVGNNQPVSLIISNTLSTTDYLQFGSASGNGQLSANASTGDAVMRTNKNLILQASGAGNAHVFIRTSGNVGIGTATPVYLLEVNGTAAFTTSISSASIQGTNTTVTNAVHTNISTSTLFSTTGSFGTVSSSLLSATTMTGGSISLSGNLNVAGTLTVVNITSTNMVETNITTATLLATTSVSSGILNATNTTVTNAVHTTLSSGNIVISGNMLLPIASRFTTSITDNFIYSGNTVGHYSLSWNTDPAFGGSGSMSYLSGFAGIRLFTSSTPRVNILDNGNVGIATTSPAYTLDISGTARITTALTSANIFVSGVSNLNGNSNTLGSIITTGGNVGVGTVTPGYKLHVSGDIYASGDITAFSDIRLKENIVQLSGCLDKIDNMRGVSFNRIDTGTTHIGLIAQEVEAQFPELVATDPNTGFKSVNYGNVVAVLLECIRELKGEVNELKTRII